MTCFIGLAGLPQIPALIVLTKADKLSEIDRARLKKNLADIPLLAGKPFLFFLRLRVKAKMTSGNGFVNFFKTSGEANIYLSEESPLEELDDS